MKILIKHLTTQRYADGNGSWSSVPEGGFNFASTDAAIDFVVSNRLSGSPVALCLLGPEDSIEYPLPRSTSVLLELLHHARTVDMWCLDEACH